MLKHRILTALLLIPLVIAGIFLLPPILFAIISGALLLLAAWEWADVFMELKCLWAKISYVATMALLMWISTNLSSIGILWFSVMWWLLASLWLVAFPKGLGIWRLVWIRSLVGILLILPAWEALVLLQGGFLNVGPWYLLLMLVIVWGMDTGAYFSGRWFGKTPLAPTISPKKTLQGVFGGIGVTTLIAIFVSIGLQLNWMQAMVVFALSYVTAAVSIIGDLVESMFKRYQNVKDSGRLLPGHGGILDRLDSMLAAAPFFAIMIIILELIGA